MSCGAYFPLLSKIEGMFRPTKVLIKFLYSKVMYMIHALSFEGRVYGYRVTAVACRINPAQPNYYQGSYHIHSLTCTCYIRGKRTFGGNEFRGKWSSGEMI